MGGCRKCKKEQLFYPHTNGRDLLRGRKSGKYRCQGPKVKGHSLGFSGSSPKRQTKPHTNPLTFIVQELETGRETKETWANSVKVVVVEQHLCQVQDLMPNQLGFPHNAALKHIYFVPDRSTVVMVRAVRCDWGGGRLGTADVHPWSCPRSRTPLHLTNSLKRTGKICLQTGSKTQ